MNPYKHEAITNNYDVRLVDCFMKQNPGNRWLSPKTVASWMFETNTPSPLQVSYCQRKLVSILGMIYTSSAEKSFLEKGRTKGDTYSYVYRLKGSAAAKAGRTCSLAEDDGVELVFSGSKVLG